MKLIKRALLPIFILSIALTGCSAPADSSSLVLNKKGALTQTIELNSIRTKETKVTVKMTYQDLASYAEYNQVILFQGTVAQCQAAGYLLEGEFKTADGEVVDRTQVLNAGDACTVLVFQEPLSVKLPGRILYCSNSLEIISGKEVKASLEENSTGFLLSNPVYVIYK